MPFGRETHLGELVTALVDGALDHEGRDRALVHLAHCAECRAEVEVHRRLKARLADLSGPPVPLGLLDKLRALPDAAPPSAARDDAGLPPVRMVATFRPRVAPLVSGVDVDVEAPRAALVTAGAAAKPGGRPGKARRPATRPAGAAAPRGPGRSRRRVTTTAAGGIAAFALALATVAVLGGGDEPATVSPAVNTFTVEHNRVSGQLPGADTGSGAVDAVDRGR